MRVAHLVITRFNLQPWKGDDPNRHLDPVWLEGRLEAFRQVCAPCMEQQTIDDFQWFVIIDPRTPDSVRHALSSASRHVALVEVTSHAVKGRSTRELVLAACTPAEPDLVVQTRIDSDDAIAPDYLQQVRASLSPGRTEFLAFRRGYQLDRRSGHAYRRTWTSGPFMSLAQPPSPHPISIYDVPHPRVSRVAPLRHIETPGMWLQTLHGLNVSSELQDGIPVPARRILVRFPVDPGLVRPRTAPELATHVARWSRRRGRGWRPDMLLRRVVPPGMAGPLREDRRRGRLRTQLDVLASDVTRPPGSDQLERLVEAWGGHLKTPSTSFLRAVAVAAIEGHPVVELGTGLTTLLLSVYGRRDAKSYEADPARLREMQGLIGRIDEPFASRLSSTEGFRVDVGTGTARSPVVVVNGATRHEDGPGGYDELAAAAGSLPAGTVLLLDDAHEAYARGLVDPSGAFPDAGWEVVHCPLKPWMRGRVGASAFDPADELVSDS
jgi:hypothetical protein